MAADRTDTTDFATALLCVESRAARLEAHTAADPGLGRLWRAEAALTEAVRSVGLEDVHVREGDLVAKLAENRVTGPEGQGIAAACDVLRALQAPGDLVNRPGETLDRLARAGAVDDAARGQARTPSGAPEATARRMGVAGDGQGAGAWDRHLPEGIAADLAAGPGTVLPALRIAGRVAGATEPQRPIVDRLAFVAADHALRRAAAARPEMSTRDRAAVEDDPLAELGTAGQGAWVLLPATALSADGFRAWAPMRRQGLRDLLAGLGTALGRELGRLGELRHWREVVVPGFVDGPRRGGWRDLVGHLQRRPLVTAPVVAAALGVTGQTARNLIAAAETAGVLAPVTRRDRYRVWATTGLAERLAARTPSWRRPDAAAVAAADPHGNATPQRDLTALEVGVQAPTAEACVDTLMDELGAAIDGLDAVVASPER